MLCFHKLSEERTVGTRVYLNQLLMQFQMSNRRMLRQFYYTIIIWPEAQAPLFNLFVLHAGSGWSFRQCHTVPR
jgi:hypothetical protein